MRALALFGAVIFQGAVLACSAEPPADFAAFRAELKRDPHLAGEPRMFPPPVVPAEAGLTPIFYGGPNFKGHETRVFGWLGMPAAEAPRPVPGVVLIHGGGGTAFAEYVREWTKRGYAALAMDLEGHLPVPNPGDAASRWQGHPWSGPARIGIFDDAAEPLGEQWPYHALCAILQARAVLAAQPGVDSGRIGYTGFSWGGILTILAAGLDERASFAVPIYGCGFLPEGDTSVSHAITKKTGEALEHSLHWWEPANYLSYIRAPSLWVNGSNDAHFTIHSWDHSIRVLAPPAWRSLHLRMAHGGKPAWEAPEPYAFADAVFGRRPSLPQWEEVKREGEVVAARRPAGELKECALEFTTEEGLWAERNWQTLPLQTEGERVKATVPAGTRVLFLSATTAEGLIITSEVARDPGTLNSFIDCLFGRLGTCEASATFFAAKQKGPLPEQRPFRKAIES